MSHLLDVETRTRCTVVHTMCRLLVASACAEVDPSSNNGFSKDSARVTLVALSARISKRRRAVPKSRSGRLSPALGSIVTSVDQRWEQAGDNTTHRQRRHTTDSSQGSSFSLSLWPVGLAKISARTTSGRRCIGGSARRARDRAMTSFICCFQ